MSCTCTLAELKKKASIHKIKGRSKMNKADLCRELKKRNVSVNCPNRKRQSRSRSKKLTCIPTNFTRCNTMCTLAELKKFASQQKIRGTSKMNKAELCMTLNSTYFM